MNFVFSICDEKDSCSNKDTIISGLKDFSHQIDLSFDLGFHFPFQHLTSVFLLHGFDTLELFSDLNRTDLDELEIKNPEERAKLLTAAQMLWDYEGQ